MSSSDVTDRILLQVGRVSDALNPVRITGRVLGIVAAALYLASLVAARGPRSVQ
jgi:hypothetical protein